MNPCKLCGGSNTVIDHKTYWTGMRSQLLSVELRHWCENIDEDTFSTRYMNIRAKTEEKAIEIWSR